MRFRISEKFNESEQKLVLVLVFYSEGSEKSYEKPFALCRHQERTEMKL
jgi:hypothetical protein